ncbi:hypothetical protein BGZ97_005067 [Linnemannia gamsii]|uniref:Uncharacterized protein n=1 Tax=Linnemannia gamsii TaxID=64522 RepID=A0A9P6UGL6_9FUNG|nr:hypothetical protein BGZ97_005067 [Linnemannia gamsii]
MPADSLSNLDDLIVTDGPARTSVTPYTDGRDNYASGDEGWEVTREAVGDDASDGVVEDYLPRADDDGDDFEEEEERLVRNTRRRQPSVERTPAAAPVSRRQAVLADLNPDLEKRPRSGGKSKKEQPQKDLRSSLTDLEGLGRYEIDAKKAIELRQLELS